MSVVGLARGFYESRSGAASTICRQLGLAGIGIIWAFRVVERSDVSVPESLLLPATLIVVSLALDLLHYAVASAMWGVLARVYELRENKGKQVPEKAPPWINWPAIGLYWGKLGVMGWAYCLLLKYLAAMVR